MTANSITLTLTGAKSLVLFEWLAKLDASQVPALDHPSEEKVLWKLHGQLEAALTEPFAPDYRELLAEARRKVENGAE